MNSFFLKIRLAIAFLLVASIGHAHDYLDEDIGYADDNGYAYDYDDQHSGDNRLVYDGQSYIENEEDYEDGYGGDESLVYDGEYAYGENDEDYEDGYGGDESLVYKGKYAYGENEEHYSSMSDEWECCSCCELTCCGRAFIGGELLYWRAFESGLDTCVPTAVSDSTSGSVVTSTFYGKGKDLRFKWRPGFRIGAGYESACNCWDVGATWTYFHSKAQNGSGFKWNINLDVVDLLAGYECGCDSCYAMRPFVGVRGARIDQKLRIQSSTDGSVVNNSNRQNFWGVGPLVGLGGDLSLGCGFSLYASGSISWLYGNFHLKAINSDSTVDTVDFCSVRKHLDASVGSADLALGIRWQTCWCNTEWVLQCGLEHHGYFDYNRICNGDLSFDGVNFSVAIGF